MILCGTPHLPQYLLSHLGLHPTSAVFSSATNLLTISVFHHTIWLCTSLRRDVGQDFSLNRKTYRSFYCIQVYFQREIVKEDKRLKADRRIARNDSYRRPGRSRFEECHPIVRMADWLWRMRHRQWSWLNSKSQLKVFLKTDLEIVYWVFGFVAKMKEKQNKYHKKRRENKFF